MQSHEWVEHSLNGHTTIWRLIAFEDWVCIFSSNSPRALVDLKLAIIAAIFSIIYSFPEWLEHSRTSSLTTWQASPSLWIRLENTEAGSCSALNLQHSKIIVFGFFLACIRSFLMKRRQESKEKARMQGRSAAKGLGTQSNPGQAFLLKHWKNCTKFGYREVYNLILTKVCPQQVNFMLLITSKVMPSLVFLCQTTKQSY